MQLKSSSLAICGGTSLRTRKCNDRECCAIKSKTKQNYFIEIFHKISQMSAQIELEKYLVHTNFIAKNP